MIRLVLALICLACPLSAEVATVRSGEHSGFSRLVVSLEGPSDWVFGRVADGYELRLSRPDIRFDLSGVYTRIPKTRIGAVAAADRGAILSVTASCACHADIFEFRPGMIVVDLKDGPPPPGSAFEKVLDVPAPVGPKAAPTVKSADMTMMQDMLLRDLGQAAAAGSIEMAIAPGQAPPLPVQAGPQIRVLPEPGFDIRLGGGAQPARQDGARCIADEDLQIADWLGDGSPALALGILRSGLAGEFDDLQKQPVENLVRAYLSMGFGAEARQLIPMMGGGAMSEAYLAMADIVDGEVPKASTFLGMENCDGAAALWAVMSRPGLRPSEPIDSEAIVRSFSALPFGLRQSLIDRLGQRLLDQGDSEAARKVKASVTRAGAEGKEASTLLAAQLASQNGDTGQARRMLDEVIDSRDPREPQALINRVDLAVQSGEALPVALVGDIETALGMQGGENAALLRALVLARALSGDFDGALSDVAKVPEVAPQLWAIMADKAPDSVVLEHAVVADPSALPKAPHDTDRKFARRLLALGFPDHALHWLGRAAPNIAAALAEDRILAAEITLARRDARQAMTILAGEQHVDAARLRAKAALLLDDPSLAASIYDGMGEGEFAADARHLMRDWASVAKGAEAGWSAAAQAVLSGPAPVAPVPSLAVSRDLLADSGAARQALADLLGAF